MLALSLYTCICTYSNPQFVFFTQMDVKFCQAPFWHLQSNPVLLSSSHVNYAHVFPNVKPSLHSWETAFILRCCLVLLVKTLLKISARISINLYLLLIVYSTNSCVY